MRHVGFGFRINAGRRISKLASAPPVGLDPTPHRVEILFKAALPLTWPLHKSLMHNTHPLGQAFQPRFTPCGLTAEGTMKFRLREAVGDNHLLNRDRTVALTVKELSRFRQDDFAGGVYRTFNNQTLSLRFGQDGRQVMDVLKV